VAMKPKIAAAESAAKDLVIEAQAERIAGPTAADPAVTTDQGHNPAAQVAFVNPAARAAFAKMEFPMKDQMDKAVNVAQDFVSFGQGNVEALVKSSQIWAAGLQDLSKQFAATAQAQMDETMGVFKALAGVKSVKDAVDLHTNLARSAMEKTVAEAGRLTDASFKLAEQAAAPLMARLTLAVDQFAKTA